MVSITVPESVARQMRNEGTESMIFSASSENRSLRTDKPIRRAPLGGFMVTNNDDAPPTEVAQHESQRGANLVPGIEVSGNVDEQDNNHGLANSPHHRFERDSLFSGSVATSQVPPTYYARPQSPRPPSYQSRRSAPTVQP
jgi:hypothetical protein